MAALTTSVRCAAGPQRATRKNAGKACAERWGQRGAAAEATAGGPLPSGSLVQATAAPPRGFQPAPKGPYKSTAASAPPRPSYRAPTPGQPGAKAASSGPLLRVAVVVPACHLIYGEQLVVVGSCEELGAWDVAAAPRLAWQEGDSWAAQLRLPAGTHSFKMVIVRADGAPFWEEGPDRLLEVPEGAAAVAAASGTGMIVSCNYGDWQQPDVTLATAAQLDAHVAPAAKQPAASASGFDAPAAGDVVAPASAASKPVVTGDALARAARILESAKPTLATA